MTLRIFLVVVTQHSLMEDFYGFFSFGTVFFFITFFPLPTQLIAHYYEWRRPSVNKSPSVHCCEQYQTTDAIRQCLSLRAVLIHPILKMPEVKWFTLKTGQGLKRVCVSWLCYVTPGHCSIFPFEISKHTGLAGSSERTTSSSLERMLLRETAAEYNSEARKIRKSEVLVWDRRK